MINKDENFVWTVKYEYQYIEEFLQKQKLRFIKDKDYEIENKISFNPPFVYSFYDFLIDTLRIPTQTEFTNYYVDNNIDYIKSKIKLNKIPFLKARLFRTYPSIIRDFHFYNYLRGKNLNVFFNPVVDFEDGHDLIIDNNLSVNLYTDTKRGNSFREKKPNRHLTSSLKELNLPLKFSESKECGDFFLYNEIHYNKILMARG